jgi:hypothetical protein
MLFVGVERSAVVLLFLLWYYCSSFYFLATSQLMSATGVVVQLMFNKADEVGLVVFGVAGRPLLCMKCIQFMLE